MRYLLLLLLITSCASRKVAIVKEESKITIDSTAIVKTDSVSTTNNNIKTAESLEEFEICPISDSIPMIINGISYKNAVIRYKKSNKISVDTSNKIVSKNTTKSVRLKKNQTNKLKNKVVDKKINYLWLLLIPIGMVIYREIKRKLWL